MMNSKLDLAAKIITTNDVVKDVEHIITEATNTSIRSINIVLLQRNWLIGKRIDEEILSNDNKENYGKELISNLSKRLSLKYGKGFTKTNLYNCVKFYTVYKNIFQSVSGKSFLSWTHYCELLLIDNEKLRNWYEKEALEGMWSVRTLQHNISTKLFERSKRGISFGQRDINPEDEAVVEFIRDPVVLSMIGIESDPPKKERDLEKAILDHIEKFMLDLGKGYAFVGRQKRIKVLDGDFRVDLVFFNYLMNCFVLVELKTGKLKHEDIGQIDSYVRMYDDLIKQENHNPTIGILLCDEISDQMVRYSFLKDAQNLFATEYECYMPSKERLKAEIVHQKKLYLEQHKK